MSYSSLLINICTIQRNTPGAQDAYGQPTASWANHLVDESCRIMGTSGREIKVGAEVVVADYKLFLDDVDVTEQDRVVLGSVIYEMLLVQRIQNGTGGHHRECFLRVVR
jgi:hypothetical protein